MHALQTFLAIAPALRRHACGSKARRAAVWLMASLLACAICATGCASGRAQAQRDRALLSLHPTNETRMASVATNDYVPCGVWRIRGQRNTLYLAGTAHLVTRDQIPFPSPFYAAYHDSQEVYLEIDVNLSRIGGIGMTFKMLKWIRLHRTEILCPKGRTVADYLSPDTGQRLKAFYGKDYPKRAQMTPLFLAFMGGLEDMAKQVTTEGGVDEVFATFARKDHKPIRELDDSSVDEVALRVLDEMLLDLRREISTRGADAVVEENVLGEKKPIKETMWRDGDPAAIEREIEEMRRELPALYEKLGPERNRKWLSKLKAVLRGDRNVIVLAGAAHFGGKDGLLQLLQEAGFTVEQMYGVDATRVPAPGDPSEPANTRREETQPSDFTR
jgi:hypothetical protein